MIANEKKLTLQGIWDIKINTNPSHPVALKDVLYSTDLQRNLLSVKRATENNFKLIFDKEFNNGRI